ncbi:MAG: TusE/DsrC/DsvC family sulfur relay protein [Chromatiaceae bacterium]|nr:TusE/DsrC/DsvC family sulfur relay protein [Chromatiaceae bacterium]MCP5313951.1 TusE/DsrC/DsvC family sulfur relay protein [Chromatiaceae bacterium]
MASTIGIRPADPLPSFPFAPEGWQPSDVARLAAQQGLVLREEHFEVVRALQAYVSTHDQPRFSARELRDALDLRFHSRGGIGFLYRLFPGGPVAQGCQFAGLPVPTGAIDRSFGSVQ